MGSRLWEFKSAGGVEGLPLVYAQDNGIFHAMVVDREGAIRLHIIEENVDIEAGPELLDLTGANSLHRMYFNWPFYLVPEAFANAHQPDMKGEQNARAVTKDMLLVSSLPAEDFHAAVPLFNLAAENAEKHSEYILVCVQKEHCLLFYFRQGKCELANIYRVQNDSEVLYFCAAPLKKAGVPVNLARVEILADAEQTQSLLKTIERFIPGVAKVRLELPYTAGEYPPYATQAFLLYHYSVACGLPAER